MRFDVHQHLKPLLTPLKTISTLLAYFFRCRHHSITQGEGRYICPDCGDAVVMEWVVTKCGSCYHQRQTVSLWGEVQPLSSFCHHCGDTAYTIEHLKQPAFYQLNHAVLSIQAENTYLDKMNRLFKQNINNISAWVDNENTFIPIALIANN